ncbi:hypothetical protein [uncultured Tessaracoccus sp.]|uniref:hypothetical protein n=1 Tax=uncultured Tessaracoccus sp. TaxID=905023 RepID=UPI0025EBBFD5|nr:hypothetical protein [uncultured Tessaracoccus sp.]
MSSDEWAPGVTINGSTSYQAKREMEYGFLDPLQRMNGDKLYSYVLWHYPADEEFSHPDFLTDYLQCAGTAERLTVELRTTHPDGTHTHWTLGHATPTGTANEPIHWNGNTTTVHPQEVWTAEQAAPLFEQYATHRTIPDHVHRRELDL